MPKYNNVKKALSALSNAGLDLMQFYYFIAGIPGIIRAAVQYEKRNMQSNYMPLRIMDMQLKVRDYNDNAGVVKGHYFHQDLYCARKIYRRRPVRHLDIGSRLDGFVRIC